MRHSDTLRGRIEELQLTLKKSEELWLVCDQDLKEQLLLLVSEVRLYISELQQKKRDRSPREIVAQVLDYASWVVTLTTKQVYDLGTAKLTGSVPKRSKKNSAIRCLKL